MRSSDFLFHLIKALSKGDRRNFKLFARLQEGDKKYIQLFDAIDKQENYDEKKLLEQFKGERFTRQFSVAKNYLYNYILKTLHIFHKDQHTELSTLLHQIQILMGKNLFDQAHKMVRKAKHLAEKQERFQEMLYLLQYEREILHNSRKTKEFEVFIQGIQEEESLNAEKLINYLAYKKLHDQVYVLTKKSSTARVKDENKKLEEIENQELLQNPEKALSVKAEIKRLDILCDCSRFRQDLPQCLNLSLNIIEKYETHPSLQDENKQWFVTNLSNLGVYLYYIEGYDEAIKVLEKIKQIKPSNTQEELLIFETYYLFLIALVVETGDVNKGKEVAKEIEKKLKTLNGRLRKSKELWIYYMTAYFWLTSGDPKASLPWINKVLNEPKMEIRTDIQCMARILNLIIHFELGNKDLLEYNLKSSTRFIANRNRLFGFEKTALKYLRKLTFAQSQEEESSILGEFSKDIKEVLEDKYEQKALILLDLPNWIESKRKQTTMANLFQKELVKK